MFLGAVSGGLVALGLIAAAAGVSTAFYAFPLTLLPTLALVGLATFNRALQWGIETSATQPGSRGYAGSYFQYAPELVGYPAQRPAGAATMQGIGGGRWQRFFFTVSGNGRARHRRTGRHRGRRATHCRRLRPSARRDTRRRRPRRRRRVRLPRLDVAAAAALLPNKE
jgi:hypothetical protein